MVADKRSTLFVLAVMLNLHAVPSAWAQAEVHRVQSEAAGEGQGGNAQATAVGGERSSDTIELSLADAVRRALEVNPDFRALSAQLDQAKAAVRLLLARLLPSASLTSTYTHSDQEVRLGDSVVVDQDSFSLSGDLTVSLFNPRSLGDYLVARPELDSTRASAEFTRDAMVLAVIDLVVGLQRAQASLEAAQASIGRRESYLRAARMRLSSGLTDRAEVQRSELSLIEAEMQRDTALAAEELAQEALRLVLNLPSGVRIRPLRESAPPSVSTSPGGQDGSPAVRTDDESTEGPGLNPGQVTAVGEPLGSTEVTGGGPEQAVQVDPIGGWTPEDRFDVRAQQQLEERDRIAERFTWLDFLPDILFGIGFTQGSSTFRDPDGFSWQIDLRATLNLYDGGARYGRMDRERANRDLHAAQIESTRAQAMSEVRQAALRLDATRREAETSSRALHIAQEYWADTIRMREAGLVSVLEVLDAEEQLARAEIQARLLEQDLQLYAWRLLHARGELSGVLGY